MKRNEKLLHVKRSISRYDDNKLFETLELLVLHNVHRNVIDRLESFIVVLLLCNEGLVYVRNDSTLCNGGFDEFV